jgi:hypothetical protein
MIQNLKQYKTTRKAQKRFQKSLQKMEAIENKDHMDKIIIDATKSFLEEFETNILEFKIARNKKFVLNNFFFTTEI